jgi:2-keto-4-pentenoate hydratase/2-oxohepta-3-ene-1,7-dioic acid hydratase in catechol pathway
MKIVRVISGGRAIYAELRGDEVFAFDGEFPQSLRSTQQRLAAEKRLAPVVPTDILCIGLNYRQHAIETGAAIPDHPVLFMKPGGALNHPGAAIRIPALTQQVDYECELAIVMRADARNVRRSEALSYVLGYTCANDVSARDWQNDRSRSGGQWCRAKGFDGFCPLGPVLVSTDEIPDPNKLRIRTLLNGEVMQDSSTADMIFSVPELIERLSATMTLRAGAVILTGTPPGVGVARKPQVFLKPGDHVAVEIEGIGRLENTVEAALC